MHILSRLERLDLLESWLRSDEPMILRDVAAEMGVSLRTVHRDIEVLRERGVPIETERGRGGGVRLLNDWSIGRIKLTHAEAIDLLIGLAISEHHGQAMQMSTASAIRRKLLASFSHEDQRRIGSLRNRIRTGQPSSATVLETLNPDGIQVGGSLKQAFLRMRLAEIAYTDGQCRKSVRRIEPHYLVHNPPVWYVMCFDQNRADIRTFRCDRIGHCQVLDVGFALRPWTDFAPAMAGNETAQI